MYTAEQVKDLVLQHSREITTLQESIKSANRRIGENAKIISGINDLAKNIAEMTVELKHLATRFDSSVKRIEDGQKLQGERIGELEKIATTTTRIEKYIEDHNNRINAIEKAPAHKWEKFTWIIISGIGAAVISYFMRYIG